MTGPLRGAIIAAGDGTRLRADGFAQPKPLVPVGGVPLIERTVWNFLAAGIASLTVIVNEGGAACLAHLRARFPDLDLCGIVKTTPSSLESFRAVVGGPEAGRMVVSTVDAVCRPEDFARFVAAAAARPADATVLAVTPLVADERPLWVRVDDSGRVTSIGGAGGSMVTAGFYVVSERARRLSPPGDLGRLRDFLGWLVRCGEPVYAESVETVVDVDRREDVALAETLIEGRRTSDAAR
jgi:NDP-sugar pyrophosphorylase family protein